MCVQHSLSKFSWKLDQRTWVYSYTCRIANPCCLCHENEVCKVRASDSLPERGHEEACARRKIRHRRGRRRTTDKLSRFISHLSSSLILIRPLSLSLSDATRVIPGTLGAKEPSPGFDDDGGRLSGKIGRDVGLANGKSGSGGNRYFDRSASTPDLPEPYFDGTPPRNVSALVGKTAFLTCVVRNLGKAKSVSTH